MSRWTKEAAQTDTFTQGVDLAKLASCPTLRHSFAMYLVEDGCDIRTIQELLGPRDMKMIMMETSVQNYGGKELTARSITADQGGLNGRSRIERQRSASSHALCRA